MSWNALLTAFGLVFVAELGDKTQLAVLTQTCKHRRPGAVFVGATLALVLVTALGTAGGQLLGSFVPERVIRIASGVAFIAMGILIVAETFRASRCAAPKSVECEPLDAVNAAQASRRDWMAFSATFGLLFVAEMGDKTQLAVLSMAGSQHSPWVVFVGGALALVAVTGMGVVGGVGLSRLIPERVLRWVSGAAFVAIGSLIGFGVL